MGRRCCVPGCTTKKTTKEEIKKYKDISFFKVPSDDVLLAEWERMIPKLKGRKTLDSKNDLVV